MFTLYLLCALVGGGLLAVSLLGGHGHDLGVGHAEAGSLGSGDLASWLSLRAVVSFAAFFGLGGLISVPLGLGSLPGLLFALAAGLSVGAFTAWAFRTARLRGETATLVSRLEGRTGLVLVAPRGDTPGQVLITAAGQREQRLARSPDTLAPGDSVLVISAERGILDVKRWEGK